MTGGSTIVEFWRSDDDAADDGSQADEILLLKQAVLDIDEDEPVGIADRTAQRSRVAILLAGLAWLGFACWAAVASGQWRGGPAVWPALVATLLVPLIMLGVGYLLLARNSRTEARRYLDTARALRTEADLLELRLGRLADQLETARQSMQDQAALLDNYGAAASSNMEASAELLAGRAQSTADQAASAERAGAQLVARMDSLIETMPELEERAARMTAGLMDNGHALSERIDTLEARLQALTELSDDARARTLAATKSLSSQLNQLQESTRSATEEVTGMADIAANRIDATIQSARSAMNLTRTDLQEQGEALESLVGRTQTGIAAASGAALAGFKQDASAVEAVLRQQLDVTLERARVILAETGDGLSNQASTLDALIERSNNSIAAASEAAAASFARDAAAAENDVQRRLDSTLADARAALAETSEGLIEQASALDSLVDRSRSSIAAIGVDTVAALTDNIGEVESRLHHLNDLMEGQRILASGLQESLTSTADIAEGRFAAMEASALGRTERLTQALAHLTAETQRIDNALTGGGVTAERLIGCAETLLMALDSSVRELDETYPAALERFDARLETSRVLLGSAAPEMERLEAISEALVGRTQEAEELLRGQGRRLTEWLESTQGGLEANRAQVENLRAALDHAHQGATRITESAGPLLITALLRVKDTADQAAERARQALGRAIPDAAQALADASEEAMRNAVDERVTAQIARLADVAEEAVKAAHQASDRLMRQLLTIADTSATVDKRIEEAERAAENRDRDHFSRRAALLIESLNSTAIDVAKILSNDVTDSSWSAYLKGDRGVFTRRAVKLLDAGESREIVLHYDEDAEFRDHVNRYIHDFESMLRVILSARDGNALGVAILSSDMGKLYVALAQAIERLRQ
ncbi:hypothetical protein WG907_11310 [Sphingobium sp. AN558]|uniref:hypothetical protein n=1 Tax=Sphingobium sp. AN558 TaxID=3133442 RepID=UPI0030C096C6